MKTCGVTLWLRWDSALSEQLTHMLISSAHTGDQPNAAALVLNAVLRVCKEINVECSQARQ